jgi:hypothetical protein
VALTVTREGIFLKCGLYQPAQPGETAPQGDPAAIRTRVPAGSPIIPLNTPARHAAPAHPWTPRCAGSSRELYFHCSVSQGEIGQRLPKGKLHHLHDDFCFQALFKLGEFRPAIRCGSMKHGPSRNQPRAQHLSKATVCTDCHRLAGLISTSRVAGVQMRVFSDRPRSTRLNQLILRVTRSFRKKGS